MQRICAGPAGQAGTRVGDTFIFSFKILFFIFYLWSFKILLNMAGKNVKLVGRLEMDQSEKGHTVKSKLTTI